MKVEAERALATTTATVGELLDRWLELAREDFSPKTTREVVGYIERNLRPALGDVRLTKLTTVSLDRYYRSLLVDGGRRPRDSEHDRGLRDRHRQPLDRRHARFVWFAFHAYT
jgi:hypothetical protein